MWPDVTRCQGNFSPLFFILHIRLINPQQQPAINLMPLSLCAHGTGDGSHQKGQSPLACVKALPARVILLLKFVVVGLGGFSNVVKLQSQGFRIDGSLHQTQYSKSWKKLCVGYCLGNLTEIGRLLLT